MLDGLYVVTVLLQGLVLLGFAKTVTNIVVFYLLPGGQSVLYKNKATEKVSQQSEFAELGLKAALAANQFRLFDATLSGRVEGEDIVRCFAKVPGITAEQAHRIAVAIMRDADLDVSNDSGSLDFNEFVTCLEGDAIDFERFLADLPTSDDAPDAVRCKEVFDEQKRLDQEGLAARGGKRPPYTQLYGKMAADMRQRLVRRPISFHEGARKRSSKKYEDLDSIEMKDAA